MVTMNVCYIHRSFVFVQTTSSVKVPVQWVTEKKWFTDVEENHEVLKFNR